MKKIEFGFVYILLVLLMAASPRFAAPSFAAAAPHADVSQEDAKAIRAVIGEQLEAFARDDAPRAFALATNGIRERFGTAEIFMAMVRQSYPVVYRPRSIDFDKAVVVDGETVQPVRMVDGDGQTWLALYPMERQANRGWRINGCQLARLSGQQI